jgi:hypothetical protein
MVGSYEYLHNWRLLKKGSPAWVMSSRSREEHRFLVSDLDGSSSVVLQLSGGLYPLNDAFPLVPTHGLCHSRIPGIYRSFSTPSGHHVLGLDGDISFGRSRSSHRLPLPILGADPQNHPKLQPLIKCSWIKPNPCTKNKFPWLYTRLALTRFISAVLNRR